MITGQTGTVRPRALFFKWSANALIQLKSGKIGRETEFLANPC